METFCQIALFVVSPRLRLIHSVSKNLADRGAVDIYARIDMIADVVAYDSPALGKAVMKTFAVVAFKMVVIPMDVLVPHTLPIMPSSGSKGPNPQSVQTLGSVRSVSLQTVCPVIVSNPDVVCIDVVKRVVPRAMERATVHPHVRAVLCQ